MSDFLHPVNGGTTDTEFFEPWAERKVRKARERAESKAEAEADAADTEADKRRAADAAYARVYRTVKNPTKHKATRRAWEAKNRDTINSQWRAWYAANKDEWNAARAKRAAKKSSPQ